MKKNILNSQIAIFLMNKFQSIKQQQIKNLLKLLLYLIKNLKIFDKLNNKKIYVSSYNYSLLLARK